MSGATRPRAWVAAGAVALLAACGTPPKPAELVSFEQMRIEGYAQTVKERFPELHAESDRYYKKAIEAHEDGEPELALHYTRMATITWRTAVARSQEKDAEDSRRAALNRQRIAQEQLDEAQKRVATAEAAIQRMERIREMQARLAETEARARKERRAAEAKQRIDAVALKIREAEGLEAARHAPGPLNKARASLKMALDAFEGGNFNEAAETAATALADAEQAIAAAKPLFEKEERERAIDARLRALLEATTRLPDSEGRITPRGLVLSVRELFRAGKTDIRPDKSATLDQVAELARTFSEFKLVIEGHTDNRGRSETNLVLSQGRAQAVVARLAEKGVAADRLSAVGKGDSEPIADNSTRDGRAQNRRVDVVFLRP